MARCEVDGNRRIIFTVFAVFMIYKYTYTELCYREDHHYSDHYVYYNYRNRECKVLHLSFFFFPPLSLCAFISTC